MGGGLGEGKFEELCDLFSLHGGYSDDGGYAEAMKLVEKRCLLWGVDLVDGKAEGLAGFLEDFCKRAVEVEGARLAVDGQNEGVGLLDGDLSLALDLLVEGAVACGVDSPSVYEGEGTAKEIGVGVEAVARDPLSCVDDGDPLADNSVKEGRLSYVGSTDDGNFWNIHDYS